MKIRHDFHIHTDLSLCAKNTATVENYLVIGKKLGLKKMGFANHFWDSNIEGASAWYAKQNLDHITQIKSQLDIFKGSGIEAYFGCECEYDPYHRGVAVTEGVAEQFDFILVPNSHTHMMMPKDCYEPYQKHVDFMIQAFEDIINSPVSRYVTAIAHPFEAVCCPYPNTELIKMMSDDCLKRLFDKLANKGIAYEINVSHMFKKSHEDIEACPHIRMYRLAKECGCRFIFGSDAHDNLKHTKYDDAQFTADLLGLTEKDILDIAL